ncbi:MAG: substrate-binding domain-containing protein [Myxococcales bacterium]|nr:substrate-binding domain-containing protein [Myxococcales bacterium]
MAAETETVRAGTYPLYRPLILYTRSPAPTQAADFIAFVLSPRGRALVAEHGFVAASAHGWR